MFLSLYIMNKKAMKSKKVNIGGVSDNLRKVITDRLTGKTKQKTNQLDLLEEAMVVVAHIECMKCGVEQFAEVYNDEGFVAKQFYDSGWRAHGKDETILCKDCIKR
jgi:hypothetical protein